MKSAFEAALEKLTHLEDRPSNSGRNSPKDSGQLADALRLLISYKVRSALKFYILHKPTKNHLNFEIFTVFLLKLILTCLCVLERARHNTSYGARATDASRVPRGCCAHPERRERQPDTRTAPQRGATGKVSEDFRLFSVK